MDIIDLPYKSEYAKTGRAGCKGCKTNIGQGSLRIAVMVQSAFHDGKMPNWFHEACFFKKHRPACSGDIAHFQSLRFEDQERIEKKISELSSTAVTAGSVKGSKKRSKAENSALQDYGIEYAKSGRAMCRGCELKISKGVVRIQKTSYDTEAGMLYGGQPLWHHVECFAKLRNDFGWLASGEYLPGFKDLNKEDQQMVKKELPAIKAEDAPEPKKAKVEKKDAAEEAEEKQLKETMREQSKELFKFRDEVEKQLNRNLIWELLQYNKQQEVHNDTTKLLDQIADMLTFGAMEPCPDCKNSTILFEGNGYVCNGSLTEWTKCRKHFEKPPRRACKIPTEFKKKFPFLSQVSKKTKDRVYHYIPPSAATIANNLAVKKGDELDSGPKINRERPALYDWHFAFIGLKKEIEKDLKQRIEKLGGRSDAKVGEKTIAVFSTTEEVDKMSTRMKKVKELGLHVIPVEYLDSVESDPAGAVNYIRSLSLCDWGTDPASRLPQVEVKSMKSKSIFTKSVPKSMKITIKDGSAVDPQSGLDKVSHVYIKGKDKYNVVLGITDLQKNKNSFYKLQLLESDTKNKYWVFRAWGRIGTTIGDNRLQKFDTLHEAKSLFLEMYLEKTGNHFENRDNFQKFPGRMYPIDIDYGDDDMSKHDAANSSVKSKLAKPVQDLMSLMFDINTMKQTMKEFDLDMEKMPLGKLSQKQIQSAYKVLTEISNLIQNGGGNNASFIDATNRFYTLIPHDFGVRLPPLLDTKEQIEQLSQMLDSLMEIECAYNLIKTEVVSADVNPLDSHYEQLKTELQPLDKKSDEFALLKKYVQNTHAETHGMYELEIVDIFKVARQGEGRRFKPFKKLHNRRLLWHGSRLTNFVGILSHGLKIAPPEAPSTGYMFGKGIYFADMVSKSANYCCTSQLNPTGLMLLSEVALGDMLECTNANYVTKLPSGKHSTFGHGRTMPDPAESHFRKDDVEIPLGKPITDDKLKTSLLYNEFIVYDIAQVNIQYLLRMNFKYKY